MNYAETNFVKDFLPGKNARIELRNGRFADVIGGRYFDSDAKIIIQGTRIIDVVQSKAAKEAAPADFTIDCQGKTVLPGLFNTHCHITITSPTTLPEMADLKLFKAHGNEQMEKNMAECLIHGVTTIRDAYCEDLRKTSLLRERINKGELPGPRFLQSVVVGPTGGYLLERVGLVMRRLRSALGVPTVPHDLQYSGGVEFSIGATEQQVRDSVNRAVDERGAEVIKIGEQRANMSNFKPTSTVMTQKQLDALTDQARKRGLRSTIHQVSLESFRRAVKAGIDSLAHQPRDGALGKEDIDAFVAQGCFIDPTLSVAYDMSYKVKDEPHRDNPDLAMLTAFRGRVHPSVVDEYWIPAFKQAARRHCEKAERGSLQIFGILPMTTMFKYYAPAAVYGALNIRALFAAGAKITTSNDGGIPPCTPAMIQHEIDLLDLFLNAAGGGNNFQGGDALRMATINAASCLGLDKDLGSIDAGKIADLAFVDGDPFAEPRVVGSRVAALFKEGRLVIDNCELPIKKVS